MASSLPAVVMDTGTGLTKLGYAGNVEPTFVMPTALAFRNEMGTGRNAAVGRGDVLADLKFMVGEEALSCATPAHYPLMTGVVHDWDSLERLWCHCIYRYLRVEPESTDFVLAEPSCAGRDSRACIAEIMFETFRVPRLCLVSPPALSLRSSGSNTGLVVEAGEGVTHVMPIVEGFVLSQGARVLPLGGRDVTQYVLDALRERREPVAAAASRCASGALAVAQEVKERYCYVSRDALRERARFDRDLPKYVVRHNDAFEVQYEQFLAPELYFSTHVPRPCSTVAAAASGIALAEAVVEAIEACPMDCRRALYRNIVVSGGGALLPHFARRLQLEVRDSGGEGAKVAPSPQAARAEARVTTHVKARYAAWCGGSALASSCGGVFERMARTRHEYEEHGF